MGDFIARLSKTTLAILVIGAGIIFIILTDPPHTICDAQKELFIQTQTPFIYLDAKDKTTKTTIFENLTGQCKLANSPGGCYELFARMRRLLEDLDNAPSECNGKIATEFKTKAAIMSTLELMVKLAWGAKPPQTYYEKFGWLDTADMSLFCRLKSRAIESFGESAWSSFQEKFFQSLPGAKELARQNVWQNMILSENCKRYP